MDPNTAARHGYNSRDFDLGHNLRLVEPHAQRLMAGRVAMRRQTHAAHQAGHSLATASHQKWYLRLAIDNNERRTVL
jgi:hypothetical protein